MIHSVENDTQVEAEETTGRALPPLIQLIGATNITEYLDDETLTKLGRQVVRDTETDDASRKPWLDRAEVAMDAAMQVSEEKTTPWEGCANVKYPILSVAALQFHARAYGAIVPGRNIVKGAVTGQDPTGEKIRSAERISQHMSYQLLEEMPEWVEDMDKLLLAQPIEGHEFKKSYFDPSLGRNVSEWVRPVDLIVNNATRSIDTAPRITHRIRLFPYQIAEKMRSGVYREIDNLVSSTDDEKEELQELYEQHLYHDLDGDGVKEPWVVTVHKDTEKVVRIVAGFERDGIIVSVAGKMGPFTKLPPEFYPLAEVVRIEREQYFTSFPFLPSPDGGFYGVGFGQLVAPLSEVIDSLTNQMLDAASAQNAGGGFYAKNLKRDKKGDIYKKPGEWIPFDVPTGSTLRDALFPNPEQGPSGVSFSLLDLLLGVVRQITNATEIMTGDSSNANMPVGTTMALVEQGLAVYTAIYMRVFRSLKREFKRLYRLNSIYLPPESYFQVLDTGEAAQIYQKDYKGDGTDVQPVADPGASTTMQKMAKAQFLGQFINDPHFNGHEIRKRMLIAAEIEAPDAVLLPQPPQPPPPDPRIEAEAAEKMARAEKAMAEADKTMMEAQKVLAEIEKVRAEAIKAIADAESKEVGTQLSIYREQVEALRDEALEEERQEAVNGQRGTGTMEAAPGNEMVPEALGVVPAELLGGDDGMPLPGQPV